jgi:hypothetical protein
VKIARYSIFYALAASFAYVVFYARRRFLIRVRTPVASLFLIAGYAIWLPFLAMAAAEIGLQPSLAIVVAYSFRALFAAGIVFVTFLATLIFGEDSGA